MVGTTGAGTGTEAPRGPAARREALIAAARRSFVERGVEGTSLDDVIAEVGGSRRNIYAAFGGKTGLLRAVIERIIAEIAETAEMPAGDGAEPREWLVEVGTAFVRQMLDPELVAVFRRFIASGGAEGEEAERLWRAGPARFHAGLARWLRAQSEAGRLHVPDPGFSATMLPEMLRGSLQMELLMGRRAAVPDAEIRRQVTAAVEMFLRAHTPR